MNLATLGIGLQDGPLAATLGIGLAPTATAPVGYAPLRVRRLERDQLRVEFEGEIYEGTAPEIARAINARQKEAPGVDGLPPGVSILVELHQDDEAAMLITLLENLD